MAVQTGERGRTKGFDRNLHRQIASRGPHIDTKVSTDTKVQSIRLHMFGDINGGRQPYSGISSHNASLSPYPRLPDYE
jgi:hypothetical protein